jgi:hypothetical protein
VTVSLRLVKVTPEGEEEVGPEHRTMQLSMGAVPTDGKTAEEEVEAGATKEKLVEEKMKTKVFRESNTDLKRSASLSGRTLSSSSRRSSRRRASRRP